MTEEIDERPNKCFKRDNKFPLGSWNFKLENQKNSDPKKLL